MTGYTPSEGFKTILVLCGLALIAAAFWAAAAADAAVADSMPDLTLEDWQRAYGPETSSTH